MLPYFLLVFFVFASAIIVYRGKRADKRKNKIFTVASFMLVVLLESVRADTVGIDTNDYIAAFRIISRCSWRQAFSATKFEAGYVFLNRLVATFTSNPQWLLATVSLLMMLNFGYFIYHNLDDDEYAIWPVFFWITLNHLFTSMVSLRQYLALSIVINIYTVMKRGLNRRNVIVSILLLILAMFFHTSALFCIFYFSVFAYRKVNRRFIFFISIAEFFVLTFFSYFENLVLMILPRYMRYREYQGRYMGRNITTINLIFIALKVLFALLVFMLNPKREENRDLYRLSSLGIISAGITILTTQVYLLWRVGYFYDIFMVLLIPKVLKRINTRPFRVLGYLAMIIFALLYYYRQMYYNSAQAVPYRFFWDNTF